MISIRYFSIVFLVLACLSLSDGLTHSSLSHPPPFVPADLAKAEALNPGDQVTSFSVPTINNGGTFNYHAMPANASAFKQVNPVLIHAWNTQSAFYNAMWTYNEYIDDLLLRSPNATQYLFLSWSDSLYLEEAHYMQSRIQERMNSLNFTSSRKQQFNQRIYYGAVPVSKLTGPASFIPSLLTNWTDVLNQFFIYNSSQNAAERLTHRPSAFSSNQEKPWISEAFAKAPSTPARRLDGRWPWVMSMTSVFGNSSIPIAWFGDGCGNSSMPSSFGQQNPLPIQNVTGKLALILRAHADESGKCSFFQKIHNAQKSGAVGAVIVSDEGEPLIDVNCNGDNCDVLMEIPATMITWTAGQNIYQLLTTSKPQLMFQDTTSAGFHFALDAESRVQEVGWFQYPSMAFIAWEAQWFEYYERLLQKIETVQTADSSLTIPIYQQVVMSGPAYVNVTIPQAGTEGLGQWAGAYLDLQLGCPGPKDSSCPAWDRILGLFVCCNYTSGESFTNSSATCGQEIGRWITPFGRRVGRWLTEITPLLPLLSNNGSLMPTGPKEMQCTFQINCGTTENWVPTVNLILSSEANPNDYLQKLEDPWAPLPKKAANKLIPFQIVPLYEGGTFDQTYNNRTPIVFTPSAGTVKVELVSVITGHGSDNHNCAEFCITSHHFEFNNDTTFSRTFHNAGDELGCADKVPDGVLPNEYGTWLYGRDGWCDGQEVKPWVVDVTNVISLTKANTVLYWGYYDGHTPDPTENPGYIDLHSYLVYYKSG